MSKKRNPKKCVRCENLAGEKITNGEFKGYLKTCIECRNYHRIPGPNHPNAHLKGRRVTPQGYVEVLRPNGEMTEGGRRYQFEHRAVMERILGRILTTDEVVHHINGLRDDNRPENLAVIGPDERHEDRTLLRALQKRIQELETQVAEYEIIEARRISSKGL